MAQCDITAPRAATFYDGERQAGRTTDMQNANEDGGGGAVGFALTSGEDCRLLPVGGPHVAALEDTHATDEFPGLLTCSEPFDTSEI